MLDSFLIFTTKYPFIISFILGLFPALVWLWFWLKEDIHPEPAKMITLSFIGGMVAVLLVLPLQRLVYDFIKGQDSLSFLLWASIEEIAKFLTVYFIALRFKVTDEPVDDIIYLIISALGFVALENTFFLTDLIKNGDFVGVVITGNMRFIGSSLLHIIASATIGIFMAFSFYKSKLRKAIYLACGLILAILLHTSFNLFIIREAEDRLLVIFGVVWLLIVTILLLFEKVKHIKK